VSGGDVVADVLVRAGVRFLFTLCGGHISPILVSAKARGIRVVDTRHEATAVFAADSVSRLTGVPGVAAVTAGPGVTNTITAVKNAQLAQSPLVLLGGATATLLKGRGALQDIDQMALMRPHVKWAVSVARVRELAATIARAFAVAREGAPGPVFVECPVDLLYEEAVVRKWYRTASGGQGKGLRGSALRWYVERHLRRVFAGGGEPAPETPSTPSPADAGHVRRAAELLGRAERPVVVIGSQALLAPAEADALAAAVAALGTPVYLSGMARGLLGGAHPNQLRHRRQEALREADFVLLAGAPCDFRLDYGRHIGARARLVSVNLSRADLHRNRRPSLAVREPPGSFLQALAAAARPREAWRAWLATLRARDDERDAEIRAEAAAPVNGLNPLAVCQRVDAALADDSVVVADGGDFVGTASYIVRPRRPLSWLDPGPYGTLGVGAGFALGAKLVRPGADVWLLYGDGSAGYSLAEFDTFVRHRLPVIAVVGNDAGWTQIAREQVELLKDDVGTVLSASDYDRVAAGFGAAGARVEAESGLEEALAGALRAARGGQPALVNAILGRTGFRKGSISI
jgi:acetolactate synthase-1/2/3 large subunit